MKDSFSEWWQFEAKNAAITPTTYENPEITKLLASHRIVPLTEFLFLSDPHRFKDIFSSSTEFVSTYPERKSIFRKVTIPTDETFYVEGKGHFELLSNNIARHFCRLNAIELLLVETVLWFDLMPKQPGSEIYELYKDKTSKIPTGTVTGIYNTLLPTYILCKNFQVLKLRKSRKTLKYPTFQPETEQYKFAKILLYYPFHPNTDIDTDKIGNNYLRFNENT